MNPLRGANRIKARSVAIGMIGLLTAGLAAVAGPTMASAHEGGASMGGMQMSGSPADVGTTQGWYRGHTVTFTYTKDFSCGQPPTSGADSGCELGAMYDRVPAGDFDPLYVIVPLGFTPNQDTLQCPTAGSCIDHPSTIDLSRVFGSGTENNLLPPHSHLITTLADQKAEWWDVDVIGVSNQHTWDRIVAAKSYRFVNHLRRAGNPNVTDNIPTNLFLYFSAS